MLSGEDNAGERGKTTIGLISKKATFHMQLTFFVRFFAVVLHDYNVNLPETSSTFFGENVVRVLVHVFQFFTAAHFHLALVAASISHFITAATKFSCCSSNKKCPLCFLSLALDLCRSFSRWASLACDFSLFLCLSLALYSKFMDMTTCNLSLILNRQHGYTNNFRFPFSSFLTL